ncbi:copper transporter 5 [Henckelia pumila]|uniref:copper transporter 5 n=1 Tax=Henckelia pumila TaxID=405737 RepID=UPI003C6E1F5F
MMHMTFYWGRKVTILFDFWKTDSWISYLLSLAACFLISLFYQYMENRRLQFKKPPPPSSSTPLISSKLKKWSPARFAGAILFGLNSAIGYLLMLAIMSFNGGVFIAVVLGLGVGYLLFRSGDEDVAIAADNSCACA